MPFTATADQNSVEAEATADAKEDAQANVDLNLWFCGGCIGGVVVIFFSLHP